MIFRLSQRHRPLNSSLFFFFDICTHYRALPVRGLRGSYRLKVTGFGSTKNSIRSFPADTELVYRKPRRTSPYIGRSERLDVSSRLI